MPRAFLITNKRYNSGVDFDDQQYSRDASPERSVFTAEGPLCIEESSDSFKPSSPMSSAHESNGPPSPEDVPTIDRNGQNPVLPQQQQCVFGCFTNATLVTVIQQLMRQTAGKQIIPVFGTLSPKKNHSSPSSDNHVCPECGKRYSTSSNLARHRQTHRSVTDKKARKCPHCDKIYVSMPAYSMHVRTHSQGSQCPFCGKCFSRPWLLQGHIRTHTGEKPFSCGVCHKAFADKSNLRAHVQTHSHSKPYLCSRCGKAFALKSYLYKHEESSCMRLHRQQEKAIQPEPVTVQ